MTSNLRITMRTVSQSEEWREMIFGACMVLQVDFTEEILTQVTYKLAEYIHFDEETMMITIDKIDDEVILNAVREYVPVIRPDVVELLENIETRLIALEPTPNWSPNGVSYELGSQVLYSDVLYECLQPHTSQPGWIPSGLPALWKVVEQ